MANRKRKDHDEGDPEPLNFDEDDEMGEQLRISRWDARGDSEDSQYYEEEEAISPEEVDDREEEGNM